MVTFPLHQHHILSAMLCTNEPETPLWLATYVYTYSYKGAECHFVNSENKTIPQRSKVPHLSEVGL